MVKQIPHAGPQHDIGVVSFRDDVGDHAKWAKQFQAQRILHRDEVVPDTEAVEVKLTGTGPWQLPDGSDEFEIIFTPGHTEAHAVLYYKAEKALFTGRNRKINHSCLSQDEYMYRVSLQARELHVHSMSLWRWCLHCVCIVQQW